MGKYHSMNPRRQTNRATMMRRVAAIAAIILLLGQTIAAAHCHPVSRQPELSSSGAGLSDSSCAICAAQLHSPAAAAVAPALDKPAARENPVACAVFSGPLSVYIGHCFGRAPPASI
jgi:hypothetical protein